MDDNREKSGTYIKNESNESNPHKTAYTIPFHCRPEILKLDVITRSRYIYLFHKEMELRQHGVLDSSFGKNNVQIAMAASETQINKLQSLDSLRTSFVSKNADDNAYEDIFEDNFERHVAIVHTMCKQSLPSDKIDAEEETSNVGTEDTWNNNFQPTKGTDENTNADVSMAERPYFHYVESFDVYQNKSRADVLFDNLLNDQHKQDNPPVRRRIIPPIPVKKGHTYKRNERSTKQTGNKQSKKPLKSINKNKRSKYNPLMEHDGEEYSCPCCHESFSSSEIEVHAATCCE